MAFLNKITQDYSIHSMGNGQLLVYGQGPNINHVFGPPYTSSEQVVIKSDESLMWETKRKTGSRIWEHTGYNQQAIVIRFTDVMHPDYPIWIRQIEVLKDVVSLHVKWPEFAQMMDGNLSGNPIFQRIRIPGGSPLFMYHSLEPLFHLVHISGEFDLLSAEGMQWQLQFRKGISEIRIAGGPTYPENRLWESRSSQTSFNQIAAAEEASYRIFPRIQPFIPEECPEELRKEVTRIAEDVAVLITAQQSGDGAIVAGYPFPLGYVRDQYGVARGLLDLGLYEEAERLMLFRLHKWKTHGNLKNAETAGGEGIRHIHENDDVEITAYTILQAFDYAEAANKPERLYEWFPMLAWCFESQLIHLAGGMLPFNGDETYVAGGFLKRDALNDGSAEATLLFIESAKKLLEFAQESKLWPQQKLHSYAVIVKETEASYAGNFVKQGKFITNNPQRIRMADCALPQFRHGVCMNCDAGSDTFFGWTERAAERIYLCPRCRTEADLSTFELSESVSIPSVCLLSSFIKSNLVPLELLKPQADLILQEWKTVMQSQGNSVDHWCVGYDMGLMLMFLARTEHPFTLEFLRFVLDSRDSASSWSERYRGREHDGCRARPWESAINLSAILYALRLMY
ncbi:MAG TPA: hypothetical protein VGE40_14230 [Bacilli bacterium]